MGLRIVLDSRKHLRIWVTGAFACKVAHEALGRIRKNWPMRASCFHINLCEVTEFCPGAIEFLVMLTDMTGGEFVPDGCSDNLKAAYVLALTDATVTGDARASCRKCQIGEFAEVFAREGCP